MSSMNLWWCDYLPLTPSSWIQWTHDDATNCHSYHLHVFNELMMVRLFATHTMFIEDELAMTFINRHSYQLQGFDDSWWCDYLPLLPYHPHELNGLTMVWCWSWLHKLHELHPQNARIACTNCMHKMHELHPQSPSPELCVPCSRSHSTVWQGALAQVKKEEDKADWRL